VIARALFDKLLKICQLRHLTGGGIMRSMDTLTHALSTMLAARASHPLPPKPGQMSLAARSWAGFFAGAFPDIDFIAGFAGITAYLNYHRGITHSLLMIPLWALLLASLFSLLSRGRYEWRAFYGVCVLSLFVHIFGDIITAYGTMVFAPFSDYKLSFPTTFIIDPYFTGIILLGLILSFTLKRQAQKFALYGFAVLLVYVLAQSWWQNMAIKEAYTSIPVTKLDNAKVHALPQPVSPFNWKIIIATPEHYYVRYINLFRSEELHNSPQANIFSRANALYLPLQEIEWEVIPKFGVGPTQEIAQRIWQDDALADVRRFMLFPAVFRFEQAADYTCVWFADQRFVLGKIRTPFIFGGCEQHGTQKRRFFRWQDEHPVPLS